MEDKVLLDKEQIIDSDFSQSFVENFNKNKNFSSSYSIFFSEEVDKKIISSFMKGMEFGFFSNQVSIKSKLSFIAFDEKSDCSIIKARGFSLILVNDLNSEFYKKCKRRLSRNSLFTSINVDSEIEFSQMDEKSLLISGKNRNLKNYKRILTLKNDSDYENKIADYFEINLSSERVRSLRNILKEKISFTSRKRKDIDKIFIDASPNETKRIIPAIRYNLIFDAKILTYPKSIDVWNTELSLSELNKVEGFEYPVLLNRINIFEKIISQLDVNEKIAFSAGFDIFFFGTKIRGRSFNFPGLLGKYEIKESFIYFKPLKFSIDSNGVKQG
ncbi:MAG: hypothetical protein ACJZ9E_01325 [Gammaproteobacteria bacterium]